MPLLMEGGLLFLFDACSSALAAVFGRGNAKFVLECTAEGVNGGVAQQLRNFSGAELLFGEQQLGGSQATILIIVLYRIAGGFFKEIGEVAVIVVEGIGKPGEIAHRVEVRIDVVHDLVA